MADTWNFIFYFSLFHQSLSLAPTTYVCPKELFVGWQTTPPYIVNNATSNQKAAGFFIDIMENAIRNCCQNNITFNYVQEVEEYSTLVDLTLNSSLDLIIPIRTNVGKKRFLTFPFVEIVQSPGAVLFNVKKNTASNAIKNTIMANIPLVVVLFVWVSIFGVCFWIFEIIPNKRGADRDLKEMLCEIVEGIWWSFITLATVGYGDIFPSRGCSRILCYIWLLCSSVSVAIYTATVTSILVNECFSAFLEIKGSKIAIIKGSNEHKVVVKSSGVPYLCHNKDELINALINQNVDGGLVELYQASYYAENFKPYRIQDVLEDVKSYGVVLRSKTVKLQKCVTQELLGKQKRTYRAIRQMFPPLKTNFSKGTSEEASQSLLVPSSEEMRNTIIAIVTTILALCVLGLIREKLFLSKRHSFSPNNLDNQMLLQRMKEKSNENFQQAMNNLKYDMSTLQQTLDLIMDRMSFSTHKDLFTESQWESIKEK